MLKILADENVALRVVAVLRKEGFDVLSVFEEKLFGAPDDEVLKLAERQKRIILTHDKDFGYLIHRPNLPHGGVILLRLKNQSPKNVVNHLIPFLKKTKSTKIKNRLIIFQEERIRII